MFGQITDLPYLGSYTDALFHYDSIVPIRGSNNLRPICRTPSGRRKKQYQIRVNGLSSYGLQAAYGTDRDNPPVVCQLYNTDVLVFYPNGKVAFHNGGYPTSTTHGFANAILYYDGVSFGTRQNHTEITVGDKAYIIDPHQYFTIRRNSDGKYEAVDPEPQYEYYVKRDVLTAKRKPVLAFQKHCLAMAKLADPEQYYYGNNASSVASTLHAYHSRQTKTAYNIMLDPTMKDWGELVQGILGEASTSTSLWSRAGMHTREYGFNPVLIKEFISDVIKHTFAHEVFERREVDRRTFNGNEKYITWGERADADT
jgi:hypothetical protein